jgi:hypothetical protein
LPPVSFLDAILWIGRLVNLLQIRPAVSCSVWIGCATKRVHAILTKNGKNHLSKKMMCETDQMTHVYTLIISSPNRIFIIIIKTRKEKKR